MRKKLFALLLALALCLSLAVPAFAVSVSNTAGVNLTSAERRIYNAMEKVVLDIAAGRRTSTEVTIQFADRELGWTARELGLSSINSSNHKGPVIDKINASLDKIYTCLELNYPFDMFWANNRWNWSGSQKYTSSRLWLTRMTYSIDAASNYRGSSLSTVNPTRIAQARAVQSTAMSIVSANAGKSNLEKLAAYRDAVCDLNSYNYAALDAMHADSSVYGDPWQLVYVFDGNPDTNVVCEGYAKAFKYLCDLTDWDGDVVCYIAEGYESGETHMWNVVRMEDGKCYHMDITYCDNSQIGKDITFLATASGGGQTYTVSGGGQSFTYSYRTDQAGLFTSGYLPISSMAYVPATVTPTISFEQVNTASGPVHTDTGRAELRTIVHKNKEASADRMGLIVTDMDGQIIDHGETDTGEAAKVGTTAFEIHFILPEEFLSRLTPGETYKYSMYVIVDGETYRTPEWTFVAPGSEAPKNGTITLQIGNPYLYVNGERRAIDSAGTAPVIMNDRTLLPVRAIMEAMGGTVGWDGTSSTASITIGGNTLYLRIGYDAAWDNSGNTMSLDSAPRIINDRTMMPIRAVAEYFGASVGWDGATSTASITW